MSADWSLAVFFSVCVIMGGLFFMRSCDNMTKIDAYTRCLNLKAGKSDCAKVLEKWK